MASVDNPHLSEQFVRITRVADHLISTKQVGRYCVVSMSTCGNCLCVYDKYAHVLEQPILIHSVIQLEHSKNKDDNYHCILGDIQPISTPYGCVFPLVFKNGLCYLPQRYPTLYKIANLPQILMMSDEEWDPSIYYNPETFDNQLCLLPSLLHNICYDMYDEEGNLVLTTNVVCHNTGSNDKNNNDISTLDNDDRVLCILDLSIDTLVDTISITDIIPNLSCSS